MRGRIIALLGTLASLALGHAAQAQLSPGGIIGGLTAPFRAILGHHHRHYPRFHHRHESRTSQPQETRSTAAANHSSVSEGARPANLQGDCLAAWPKAYDQALGFVFWPDDYAAQFRARGFDVIADTISGRRSAPRVARLASTTGAAVLDDTAKEEHWPSDQIKGALQLTDAQHDALEKLQTAVAQSNRSIEGSCQDAKLATAPDRLAGLVSTLWAVRDGENSIRGQLQDFYATLSKVQKQSFASRQPGAGSTPPADSPAGSQQMQACVAQNSERAERWIKEIEMRVRPDKTEAARLENLHKTSAAMAKLLTASCAQHVPADPVARLDAAADKFTAINYAASTMQIAFNEFYAKLDNAQKAHFETAGR